MRVSNQQTIGLALNQMQAQLTALQKAQGVGAN